MDDLPTPVRHTAQWEFAGILQDIQSEPRSHELCFSHVYMKTLGFQALLPRLDMLNTFFKRSSNDHEIVCKEQLPGHPQPGQLIEQGSSHWGHRWRVFQVLKLFLFGGMDSSGKMALFRLYSREIDAFWLEGLESLNPPTFFVFASLGCTFCSPID